MKLERAVIDIRPRSAFEILDLAVRFYRAHILCILKTAAALGAPGLVLGFCLYWFLDAFFLGMLVFWLMLPLSSHAVILVASRLVFGSSVDFRETISLYRPVWLGLFARRLFQRMLWAPLLALMAGEVIRLNYVFSPMIVLLEKLSGLPGTLRLRALNRNGGARSFGFDLSVSFVALGLVAALAFFADLIGSDILDAFDQGGMFEEVISSGPKVALWMIIVLIVSPVVDLGWFFYYLDTRIRKEGWDLELGFKAIARRLKAEEEAA